MKKLLIRRAITSLITFFSAITIVFIISRLSGDPLAELLENPEVSPETVEALRRAFGLDKPLHMQYINFLIATLSGQLGYSINYKRPVLDVLIAKLPYTIALLIPAITLSNYFAYRLGVESGWRRGRKFDVLLTSSSLFIRATPHFWLAILFLYVFGAVLNWAPLFGAVTPGKVFESPWEWLLDYLWHYILPVSVITIRATGAMFLYIRNSLVEVLGEDYIMAAMAKGLPDKIVLYKHAARNALLPAVTMMGLRYAFIIDGAVLTETVFSYPGTGRLVFEAIIFRDYYLLQGAIIILTTSVILVNFLIDILYLYLDPRVRYR